MSSRWYYFFGVTLILIVFVFQFNALVEGKNKDDERIQDIYKDIAIHESMKRVDKDRSSSVNKIIDIIEKYNSTMPDLQKVDIANEIFEMSVKYPNLNIDFIAATITHESANTWDPNVVSRVGALGLMQIMPSTGEYLAAEEGIDWSSSDLLFDPLVNIRLGCRYLNEMVTMYSHDGGLAAYNAGPRIARLWLASNRDDQILWKETRGYVPAILKLYAEFQTIEEM